MTDEVHLKILKDGVRAWNTWRRSNPKIKPDLTNADLRNTDLKKYDLSGIDFRCVNFENADLSWSDLSQSDFWQATFMGTDLSHSSLSKSNLRGAHLNNANLRYANLFSADLSSTSVMGAAFNCAYVVETVMEDMCLGETILADVDLTSAIGLDECFHSGPSIVDIRTLRNSKNVPIGFWRGCGLPEALIEYMPSLTGDAIQFYSCFISYSSKDQEFAERLFADLQNKGVRCWFAPHDLPIGAKTWDGIDQAIRTRDKVLLILSEGAIASDWVEDEVTTAFAEERRRNELVLFPVRLDDAVLETDEPWAGKLKDNRNIGDFTKWKEHDAYGASFQRVLRDLRAEGQSRASVNCGP